EEVLVIAGESPPESFDVRGSEPELPRPMQDMDARLLCGDRFCLLARAIARCVVDAEDVEPRVLPQHFGDEPADVLPLVVGGDDDKGAPRAISHSSLKLSRFLVSFRGCRI